VRKWKISAKTQNLYKKKKQKKIIALKKYNNRKI